MEVGVARSENYNEGDHDGDESDCFALVFRIESPFIGSLCAGCTSRSRIASARSYGRKWCLRVRQGFEGGGGLAENVA